jgi:protein-S-isoprenylcysteine O-methyltransferase Ste14
VVEVSEGQKVIDTGPYALVRHPMYLGSAIMYLFSPLALGSAWAVIPALVMVPVLVARIISEEKLLSVELPGYAEYTQKVRYRMFPGIW